MMSAEADVRARQQEGPELEIGKKRILDAYVDSKHMRSI